MSLKHSLTVDDGRVRLWSGGVDARASLRTPGALVPSIFRSARQADAGDGREGLEGGVAASAGSAPPGSAGPAADPLAVLRRWIMDGARIPTNAH
ncbi:hypothetical protein WMF18_33045 [Sorangium sp. So ce315]|uniref:hypothetical protein n=1 Tax=Sorangium sp. So ce315 TaxID=3133299 RepID=UPI003F5F7DB1